MLNLFSNDPVVLKNVVLNGNVSFEVKHAALTYFIYDPSLTPDRVNKHYVLTFYEMLATDDGFVDRVSDDMLVDFFTRASKDLCNRPMWAPALLPLPVDRIVKLASRLDPQSRSTFLMLCGEPGAVHAVDLVNNHGVDPHVFLVRGPAIRVFRERFARAMIETARVDFADLPRGWVGCFPDYPEFLLKHLTVFDPVREFENRARQRVVYTEQLTNVDCAFDLCMKIYEVTPPHLRNHEIVQHHLLEVITHSVKITQDQRLVLWNLLTDEFINERGVSFEIISRLFDLDNPGSALAFVQEWALEYLPFDVVVSTGSSHDLLRLVAECDNVDFYGLRKLFRMADVGGVEMFVSLFPLFPSRFQDGFVLQAYECNVLARHESALIDFIPYVNVSDWDHLLSFAFSPAVIAHVPLPVLRNFVVNPDFANKKPDKYAANLLVFAEVFTTMFNSVDVKYRDLFLRLYQTFDGSFTKLVDVVQASLTP